MTRRTVPRSRRGFTLIELLVVTAVIAMLLGLLLPALASSRRGAYRVACLANLRSLEIAHMLYVHDSGGLMLGTSHGGSWIDILQDYDELLLLRSPVDTSPHFAGGVPVDGRFRRSSYAINYWVSPDNPDGVHRLDRVASPTSTAHVVIAAFEGPGAVRDHVHPHLWWSPVPSIVPAKAAAEVATHAHGGEPGTWACRSNYAFLDGHAETETFRGMYESNERNRFDPSVAQ